MNRIGKTIVTQRMIAETAKVHSSTVSLALRNDRRIPKATRRRIQAVAQRLGYSPNPLVATLMARVRRRSTLYRGTLAYLHTVQEDDARIRGWVHRNYLVGARRRAGELGYGLDEIYFDGERLKARRLVEMLRARSVSGIVIEHVPGRSCPDRTLPFALGPFAAASLGVPLAEPRIHYVANDQYMRAILAAREVLALGYRRLGMALFDTFDSGMAHRCSAGFWAVQEYIPSIARLPIFRARDRDSGKFRRWLLRHKPEVVLTNTGSILGMVGEAGLRVPEDVGVVQLDWQPEFKHATGVYGNSERTGAAAVELVVNQIHRGESGPPAHAMSYLVDGTWIAGRTVRKVGPRLDLDASFFADLLRF